MLRGHTLAKIVRQWGFVISTGAAGFVAGMAGFIVLGLDGIFQALNDIPTAAVGAALSVLLALAALAIGALIALARQRFRNRQARIALNNMSQGLCMFDGAARLVLCNMRYIEMHHLRREQLRHGMPLRELLVLRRQTGTFSDDPDRYVAACLKHVAEGRTEARTIKFEDGRVIALVARPLPNGGWVTTHSDVTEQLAAERERDSLRQQDERRRAIDSAISSFRARVESTLITVGQSAAAMKAAAKTLAYDFRPYAAARRGCGTRIQ
jgi:PAS domain-containing protein